MNPFSRRTFLGGSAASIALAGSVGASASERPDNGGVTAETIAAAEKLHGLAFTPSERNMLVNSIQEQVDIATARKKKPLPLDLQPALIFDPRLPGVEYAEQPDKIRLSASRPSVLPKDDADIAFASVIEQGEWIKSDQISSRRLTEIYLKRIRRIAPSLYCYITVAEDVARAQAEACDRELRNGQYRGPLHGIPYGLKDVFDTAGVATTWGASIYKDRVPAEDAAITTMLRQAGAVLLGKLATGTLANGAEWFGGRCRNPWNPEEAAGGSSTGSGAATAAGLCTFSIGTDSLGSILNPADRCGVVGLRPTFGRVPVKGGMPLTPSLERIGPLCRKIEDATIVLAAINGPDPTSAASIDVGFEYDAQTDLGEITVGYSPIWFERMGFGPGAMVPTAKAHQTALHVLESTGVNLVEIAWPDLPYQHLIDNLQVEAAAVFEELTLNGQDELLPSEQAWNWPNSWRRAHLISAVDYLQLERFRHLVMHAMEQIFRKVDMLFAPTYGSFELLLAMNFTGHPGVSFRAGLDRSPTRSIAFVPFNPTGPKHTITQNVSFHGRLFEEGKMLAVARAMEKSLDVWRHRPPVDA